MDWCCMCRRSGETVDDLLLQCEVARALWDDLLNRMGIEWLMPGRVVDLLAS